MADNKVRVKAPLHGTHPLSSQPVTTVNSKECIGCNKLCDVLNTLLQKPAVQYGQPLIYRKIQVT